MQKHLSAIFIALITLLVYYITVFPATRPIANSMFVLYIFVAAVGIAYWPFARTTLKTEALQTAYFLAIFVSMLLWIGVTGWFLSPFFYFLYLLAIILAFMYSSFATLLFVLVLVGLFLPNVGSIDFTVDVITIISLVSVVPLTYFLQKEYLDLKQTEKKVLILEESSKELKNKVDEVLANKVTKFSVDLRQPVNDIRQVALVSMKSKDPKKIQEALHKIAILGRESLDQIERFEVTVTGKGLVHTKNTPKSKKKSSTKKK